MTRERSCALPYLRVVGKSKRSLRVASGCGRTTYLLLNMESMYCLFFVIEGSNNIIHITFVKYGTIAYKFIKPHPLWCHKKKLASMESNGEPTATPSIFLFLLYFIWLDVPHLTYKHNAQDCIASWRCQFSLVAHTTLNIYILKEISIERSPQQWYPREGSTSEVFRHENDALTARPHLHDHRKHFSTWHVFAMLQM